MIENIQRQVPSTAGGHKNSKGEGTILNTPRPPEVRAAPSRHRRRPWRQGSKPSVSDSDPKATSASTRGRSAPRAIPPRRRPETHPPGHHRHTRVLDSTPSFSCPSRTHQHQTRHLPSLLTCPSHAFFQATQHQHHPFLSPGARRNALHLYNISLRRSLSHPQPTRRPAPTHSSAPSSSRGAGSS
jgi:hypothetical protein